MTTKLAQVKAAFDAGDLQSALRIAAKFPQLGEHKKDITRAHESYNNGHFYQQLGHDLNTLREKGRLAIIARWGFK